MPPTHRIVAVDDDVLELETERAIPVVLVVICGGTPLVFVRDSDLARDPAAVESEALFALAEFVFTGDESNVVRLDDCGDDENLDQ